MEMKCYEFSSLFGWNHVNYNNHIFFFSKTVGLSIKENPR